MAEYLENERLIYEDLEEVAQLVGFEYFRNVYGEEITKEQAEAILNQLGIPMSNAIGMFLKQVVMQRGIPFDMKLPTPVPAAVGSMTKEQFDMELQKGMDDIAEGRVISADAVEAEMRGLYGL